MGVPVCQEIKTDSPLCLYVRQTHDQNQVRILSEASMVNLNHNDQNLQHFNSWLITQGNTEENLQNLGDC